MTLQDIAVRILLFPFSLLFGLAIGLRNLLYRWGALRSASFNVPVISIGNLSVGGSGKTPHIEYLIRLLKEYIPVATLSRGYKRQTRGYMLLQPDMKARDTGDEPLQYKRKFPDIQVAVGEERALAIPQLLMDAPQVQTILLDDAFQHRAVKPGLSILLTEFNRPYFKDWLLPAGRLREWPQGATRADVIIVSKCPFDESLVNREQWLAKLKPLPRQRVFFSYYRYGHPYYFFSHRERIQLMHGQEDEQGNLLFKGLHVTLVCGIANPDYLMAYLKQKVEHIELLEFDDHHFYSDHDIQEILDTYHQMPEDHRIVLTTEKDAMRLEEHAAVFIQQQIPIFVLPIEVAFHFEEGEHFDQHIKDFLLDFKA